MHLLLEELKISLKSSCHTVSPRVESESDFGPELESRFFRAGVGVRSPIFSDPGVKSPKK